MQHETPSFYKEQRHYLTDPDLETAGMWEFIRYRRRVGRSESSPEPDLGSALEVETAWAQFRCRWRSEWSGEKGLRCKQGENKGTLRIDAQTQSQCEMNIEKWGKRSPCLFHSFIFFPSSLLSKTLHRCPH